MLTNNLVYGLDAAGTSNTTGLAAEAFAYEVFLVHNDIDGGSGGRHSFGVTTAGSPTTSSATATSPAPGSTASCGPTTWTPTW